MSVSLKQTAHGFAVSRLDAINIDAKFFMKQYLILSISFIKTSFHSIQDLQKSCEIIINYLGKYSQLPIIRTHPIIFRYLFFKYYTYRTISEKNLYYMKNCIFWKTYPFFQIYIVLGSPALWDSLAQRRRRAEKTNKSELRNHLTYRVLIYIFEVGMKTFRLN